MEQKKVLFVASVYCFLEKFEINNIKILKNMGYEIHTIANRYDYKTKSVYDTNNLEELGVIIHEMDSARNPFSIKNLKAIKVTSKLMKVEKFDIVDTHTPMGGVIGRIAGKFQRYKPIILYTAHGFHFYKGAPLLNWLLFYPIEKLCSRFTDVLITINKEDYEIAKKKFHAKRVEYVPGVGLDLSKFNHSKINKSEKRRELGVRDFDTVLLSVGELNENKNHEAVFKAMAQLKNEMSLDSVKYLICGQGEKKETLEQVAEKLGLKENIKFLGFRTDVSEIYEAANVFVFPSFREGLSVALMEAMCCGLPVICSNIRGNTDLIDKKGGILFAPDKNEEIVSALKNILKNKKERNSTMGSHNQNKIKHFSLESVGKYMTMLYRETRDVS